VSLRSLQRALASVLLDDEARRRFAKDPEAFARRAGLEGRDAALLAGLDAGDVGYFASRRRIDRRAALRADMPLTVAAMEREKAVLRYFRAHPYALEDPLAEAARAAQWAQRAAKRGRASALAADAAAFEAAWLAVRSAPPDAPRKPSPRPRRGASAQVLRLRHDLGEALEDADPAKARRRVCWLVLRHGPDGPEAGEVPEVEARLLRGADGKRSAAALVASVARAARVPAEDARRGLEGLAQEALVSPLRPASSPRRAATRARAR